MRSKHWFSVFGAIFIFSCLEASNCLAEGCVQGRPPGESFPFLGMRTKFKSLNVTIFGDANARRSTSLRRTVEKAADEWNRSCRNRRAVPIFSVDWSRDRPQRDDYGNLLLVILKPNETPIPQDTQRGDPDAVEVASWQDNNRDYNSIRLPGRCPKDKKFNLPCEGGAGSPIKWGSNWGIMVLAHEIGHALGLYHDRFHDLNGRNACGTRGVMQVEIDMDDHLQIRPEYCRFADDVNNEDSVCNRLQDEIRDDIKRGLRYNPCDEPIPGLDLEGASFECDHWPAECCTLLDRSGFVVAQLCGAPWTCSSVSACRE